MSWHAAEMPDDALPPDSLVKRIIDADKADNVTWAAPTEFCAQGARVSGSDGEPIVEFVFDECTMENGETYRLSYDAETGTVRPELLAEAEQFLEEYADDFKALAASERADLPLWRVMAESYAEATESTIRDWDAIREGNAAEIEDLRDWLLPEEPVPPFDGRNASNDEWLDRGALRQRQRLRAQLTEQARIARGER